MSQLETYYTVQEVAESLRLHPSTVRRMFDGVPGVLCLEVPSLRGKRRKVTRRIPESALSRWLQLHSAGNAEEVQPRRRRVEKTLVRRNKRSVVPLGGLDGGVAE